MRKLSIPKKTALSWKESLSFTLVVALVFDFSLFFFFDFFPQCPATLKLKWRYVSPYYLNKIQKQKIPSKTIQVNAKSRNNKIFAVYAEQFLCLWGTMILIDFQEEIFSKTNHYSRCVRFKRFPFNG